MEHKNLALDNSFTLLIQNLAGVETNVSLFRLGVTGNSVPIDSSLAVLDFDGTGYFRPALSLPTGSIPTNGTDIETASSSGAVTIRIDNASFNHITYTIPTLTNLDDCNTLINSSGLPTGTTGAEIVIGFKPKSAGLSSALETIKNMTFSVRYDSPVGSNSLITAITLTNPSTGTTAFNFAPSDYKESAVITNGSTSMVSIKDSANLTYEELLRSQNGSVLDVRSMGYNLLFANEPTTQLNQCFRFNKTDVNGKSYTNYKCPIKDPYQFQNSFGVIDMGKIADRFTLDGETSFDYTLAPFSDCQITFNYAELTNLMLLPEEVAEAQEDVVVLDEQNKEDNYKRKVVVDVPSSNSGRFHNADGNSATNGEQTIKKKNDVKLKDNKMKKMMKNPLFLVGALAVVYFAFGKKLGIRK